MRELVCLFRICDTESVKASGASDLELGFASALLNLHGTSILSASLLEEVANIVDLLRLWDVRAGGKGKEARKRIFMKGGYLTRQGDDSEVGGCEGGHCEKEEGSAAKNTNRDRKRISIRGRLATVWVYHGGWV